MLRVFSPCTVFSETEAAYFTQACSFLDIQAYFSINVIIAYAYLFLQLPIFNFSATFHLRTSRTADLSFPIKIECLSSNGVVSRDCAISIVVVRSNLALSDAALL